MNINHRLNQIKYYFARYGFFETVKKCIKRLNKKYKLKFANSIFDSNSI